MLRKAKFGGSGVFMLLDGATHRFTSVIQQSPNRLRLRSELEGCDLLLRHLLLYLLNVLTMGIFGCLFGDSFIKSFIDDHLALNVPGYNYQ